MDQKSPRALSPEAIRDFKEIYQEEFNEDLTDDEAEEIALKVLRFNWCAKCENQNRCAPCARKCDCWLNPDD